MLTLIAHAARVCIVLLSGIATAGCATMTPTQKKWTGIAVGVLVVGAVAAHRADSGAPAQQPGATFGGPALPCHPQPNGACR